MSSLLILANSSSHLAKKSLPCSAMAMRALVRSLALVSSVFNCEEKVLNWGRRSGLGLPTRSFRATSVVSTLAFSALILSAAFWMLVAVLVPLSYPVEAQPARKAAVVVSANIVTIRFISIDGFDGYL